MFCVTQSFFGCFFKTSSSDVYFSSFFSFFFSSSTNNTNHQQQHHYRQPTSLHFFFKLILFLQQPHRKKTQKHKNIRNHNSSSSCVNYILKTWSRRPRVIYILAIENSIEFYFKQPFNNTQKSKIIVLDCFSNFFGWIDEKFSHSIKSLEVESFRSVSDLQDLASRISSLIAKPDVSTTSSEEIFLAIDSLTSLILLFGISSVSNFLHKLLDVEEGRQHITTILGIFHSDVHESRIEQQLEYRASTIMKLLPPPFLIHTEQENVSGVIQILQKRNSGHIKNYSEKYFVDSNGIFSILHSTQSKRKPLSSQQSETQIKEKGIVTEIQSELTFKLTLTPEQKARLVRTSFFLIYVRILLPK